MKKEKTLREHFIVMENLTFIGLASMVAAALFEQSLFGWILLFAGILLFAAAFIYHKKFYKCPHCGGTLNARGVPKFCPDCGKPVE